MITHTATETAPPPLDVERAFLGCLLQLPHTDARRVLAGMRPDDCGDPAAGHALHFVIATVAAGHRPEPVTVFTRAQSTGEVTGEQALQRLAHWLLDAHHDAPAAAAADYLKAVVLEHAYRRAVLAHATRLHHAAQHSDITVLRELATGTTTPEELWRRYQAALDGDTARRSPARLGVAA